MHAQYCVTVLGSSVFCRFGKTVIKFGAISSVALNLSAKPD